MKRLDEFEPELDIQIRYSRVTSEIFMVLQLAKGITDAGQAVGLVASVVSPPTASMVKCESEPAVTESDDSFEECSPETPTETNSTFAARANLRASACAECVPCLESVNDGLGRNC